MRRASLIPFLFAALFWIAGCGGGSSSESSGGGSTTPNAFSGQYGFVLGGFDSNANRVAIAGSVKADGLGHITGGELDVNDNGTSTQVSSLAGTYAFDANGQSTLGTITLTNSLNGHSLGFGFSLQASGDFGQIMSLDANNFIAVGTMQLQSPSVFSLSALAGSYIVTLNGPNGSSPTAALGRFTLSAGGAGSNVVFDRSISGVGSAGPTTTATISFASSGPDSNGRGTFTLALTDGLAGGATSQNFAYYAISADRFAGVEIDSNGIVTADFSTQLNTPFTAATVDTAGCVFGMAGIDTVANNEIASVGQLVMTGAGSNTGTLHWDSNDAGTIVGPAVSTNLAVAFDPTTGRGTVTVPSGFTNGLADTVVFYLNAPGTGFILDATAGTNNRGMSGNFMPQTGLGSLSATADLAGVGITRTLGSSPNDALSLVGLFGLTSTPGDYALVFDERFPGTSSIQTELDQTSSGITLTAIDPNVGRGTATVPNSSGNSTEAFYIIGPNEFRFIDISPVSSGVNGASTLFFVSPH
jgi:hypothetical protein